MRGPLLLLTCLWLAIAGCGERESSAVSDTTLIRLADDEAKSLDPQTVSDLASIRVARDQFEGLTRYSADGEPEPGLAESWHVSADGLVWTFTLRANLAFSDGETIDSALFVSVFERLRAEETASPIAALFEAIASVEAPTPDQVRVNTCPPPPCHP